MILEEEKERGERRKEKKEYIFLYLLSIFLSVPTSLGTIGIIGIIGRIPVPGSRTRTSLP
jgi:hypothetical protein